jgi:hypothetical protein
MAVCAIPLRGNNIPTNQTHIRVYDSIVKLKRLILSFKTFALQRYYNSQKHTTYEYKKVVLVVHQKKANRLFSAICKITHNKKSSGFEIIKW